ncbi:MAG TPA: efflux RND transporter periplasmic adaptor subunit [Steroidobacteraceae bacterium]|nr:efflux RND transporter periplasmic adaptor subunit [Steroidobacteraceae bacterium]
MNPRNWIAIGVIAALIGVPLTLKLAGNGNAKKVDVEKVSQRVLSPSILASGSLAYESQVTLAPEVGGKVKDILVEEGDTVKKDQLLLRLDPATSEAEIAQIEAQIRQSQLAIEHREVDRDAQLVKLRRYEMLRKSGMIDENTYADLESQEKLAEVDLKTSREMLSQTQAQLEQAREALAKTEIRSPLSGKVTAIFIKVGETAVPSISGIAGSTLLQVADTTSIDAEINIDETDIARVAVGADAKIVPAAFPDTTLVGKVVKVAIFPRTATGSQNKSYPVKVRLTRSADLTFRPGMSCRAEVMTNSATSASSLAVPVQAIRYEDAEKKNEKAVTSVFVFKDGRVSKRIVETGTADDAYTAILKGLKDNEEIVVGPSKILNFLKDGERVAKNAPAASPASVPRA